MRQYEVEILPTSYVFQPGHRLRVDLAGGVTLAPGQTAPQGPGKNPHAADVTILQTPDRPAQVTLPVIGTGRFPTEPASVTK